MVPIRPDRALVDRLQGGDASAVSDLVAAYGAQAERVAFRYLKNREDAQEVAQDALLKASRAIGTFRGDSALGSWIHRITINAAMSRLRRSRVPPRTETTGAAHGASASLDPGVSEPAEIADWSSIPDEACLRRQLRERFRDALRSLPLIYRVPVELRDLQGLSTAEASRAIGVTSQTLKSRLHRGRTILRPRLAAFRGGLSLHPGTALGQGRRVALDAT